MVENEYKKKRVLKECLSNRGFSGLETGIYQGQVAELGGEGLMYEAMNLMNTSSMLLSLSLHARVGTMDVQSLNYILILSILNNLLKH